MAVVDFAYDNWGNIYEIDRLYYEAVVAYELETSAGIISIREPVKWDQVTFVHKRDSKRCGFNYEFIGEDIDLTFTMYSGKQEIIDEYALNGNDGLVLFRRKLTFGALTITEYEGRLNLGEMKRENYMINCPCERHSLHTLVKSRMATKINMNSDEDLNGDPVPIYSKDSVLLPGQILSEKFSAHQNVLKTASYTEPRTGATQAWGFFNVSDPSVNTMNQTFNPQTLGITASDDAVTGPYHDMFQFIADGTYTFDIELRFQILVRIHPRFNIGGRKVTNADLYVYLTLRKADNVTVNEIELFHLGNFNPDAQGFLYPIVHTINNVPDLDVEAGDRLQLYVHLGFGHNATKLQSIDFTITEFKTHVDIVGQSQAKPSIAPGYLIKRSMDYAMQRITGKEDVVFSDFYSKQGPGVPVDGCGANRVILNGGAIRAAGESFPLTFTWEQMLNSMNAIDCIGMGYEWDAVNSIETIRVEPKEYFYKDIEVIELTEVFEYKERTAKEEIYNKINIGYGKYKEEEANSLDEIHAYHEYQTPIKNDPNEYLVKSDFIASGYLIETTRRAQFSDDENLATTYDDDIFILDCFEADAEIFGTVYKPLTNEPFSDITGILSPETTVNQRLSIKRMLMAHAKWLNSSLVYKGASEVMRNQFTKQNKDYTTTLNGGDCQFGDEALLPLRAADHVILSVFGDFEGIYSPEWVDLKTELNMTQVRMIINAHRGLDPDHKDYGYISFPDDNNVMCKGWLYSLSYNRENHEVSMTLLKKKFP